MSDIQREFQRWYERQPKLAQAVKLMIVLPDEVRSIIGEATMQLADREFEATRYAESSRSLGGDKVLGLYKSKNKRREYDQNEVLHNAMNYLYILSEENQDFMANHILHMLDYIQQYFATCREFNQVPSLEEVAAMTQQYVSRGSIEVERFLQSLRSRFSSLPRNIVQPAPEVSPPAGETVTTKDDRTGMRIKKLEMD
jgi:hypothetical protein